LYSFLLPCADKSHAHQAGTFVSFLRTDGKSKNQRINKKGMDMGRKKWLAVVMGLAMPGMGQIYNGELVKGISSFIIFLVLYIVGFQCTVLLPDRLLSIGVLCTIIATTAIYAIAVIDAFRKAKNLDEVYQPTRFNRWYFYIAIWMLGYVLISGAVYDYVRNNFIEAFNIPSASMEPAVMRGDRVIADKTAYRRMAPKKGDIIIFVFIDDRSKRYIKRIEALPGDTITLADGTTQTVPHGLIYVLGDNKENSVDSRKFGFVPLSDAIAKVRQVYYSSGADGIRWNRIGKTLGGF
jgi:signal peptidase I